MREPGECNGDDDGKDPVLAMRLVLSRWKECALPALTKQRPRVEDPWALRQSIRTALPTLTYLPGGPVEVLAHDAAITTLGITSIISVAAIAGTVVTSVIVAPARANADADADANRARAYPNALRVC